VRLNHRLRAGFTIATLAALLGAAACAAGTPESTAPSGGGATATTGWLANAPAAWQELMTKAKAEGSVVVGGPAQLAQPMTAAFQRDTGLTLQWVGGTGGQLSARMQQEVAAGQSSMDLKLGGAQELLADWKSLLAPLKDQLILPSVTDGGNWRLGAIDWYDPDKAYMLKGSAYVYGWPVVNSDIVKPSDITAWQDLLKPEYKGKIASLDISQPSSGQGTGHFLMETQGEQFVRSLYKGQQVKFTADFDQAMTWLARGTYPILLGIPQSFVQKYVAQGIKAQAVLPADEPGYLTSGFSVIMQPKNPPHPAAAQVFLNWYASQPGQQAYDGVMLEVSQRKDVDLSKVPDYLKPKGGQQYWNDSDLDWYLNERGKMSEALAAIQNG
jgi:ABC-type Fe3+ transport system substrate-binding protein